MRRLLRSAARWRFLLIIGAATLILHASASASYRAVSPADGPNAAPPCSMATAAQLVEQHRLNGFQLPNPVAQLLCGEFMGPGSDAMAVTIGAAPTCWPIQSWAIFGVRQGTWRLLKEIPAYLIPPLTAVGGDIREETAVHRPGDPRCIPSGGTHARRWHWNGTAFVAGPWTQVKPGARAEASRVAVFSTPSRNIVCELSDDSRSVGAYCQSYEPPHSARLTAGGRVTICRGMRCIGDPGDAVPPTMLGYGKQRTVGRFRCRSEQVGVTCTVSRTGKGFLLNRSGVTRVG